MTIVLRVLTLLLASLSFLIIAWTLWRMRRPQPLRWLSPIIAIGGSLLALFVYLVVLGISVEPLPMAVLVLAGVGIGLLALKFVTIEARDGSRFVSRSQWFLGLWALALIALQVTSALDSPDTFAAGLAASAVSTGMVTALNLGLLRHRFSSTAPSTA